MLGDVLAQPAPARRRARGASSGGDPAAGRCRRASWSAGWAARRSAATWRPRRSAIARHRARCASSAATRSRPGSGPTRSCSARSYSGDTEETLACFEAAGAAGAPRVALTTGGPLAERAREDGVPVIGVPSGMQPRAAVVYMTVAALECAAACGAAPVLRAEIEGAADVLERAGRWTPSPVAVAGSAARHAPGRPRRRADRRARPALEDPAQRERQGRGRLRASCRRPTTTRSRAGRGLELAPLSAVFLDGPGPAPAGAAAHRADADELLASAGAPVVARRARAARRRSRRCSRW